MASINVKLDKADIDSANAMLAGIKDGLPKAYARALNKTADNTKTHLVAVARDEYNYKADAVRSRITIQRATWQDLTCRVISKGTGIHLTDILGTRETNKGVTVDVLKSTGRQLIPRTFIRAARNSGKKMVLRRPGNPRGQSLVLYGRYGPPGSGGKVGSKARLDTFYAPHPESVYNTEANWEKTEYVLDEKLKDNFSHEVDYVFKMNELV
jgi:hypothetical protein